VKQGQQFVGDVIREGGSERRGGDGGHRIPTGQWRDGLCDCFKHGICHPVVWLACCCRPLALGQILNRMNLTATGGPIPQDTINGTPRAARRSAFKTMAWILVVFLVIDYALVLSWFPYKDHMFATYDEYGNPIPPDYASVPTWAWVVRFLNHAVEFAFAVYMLVVLIRTRAHVRHRYGIREHYCTGGLEDCCCSCWCPCCTTLQIARHTADYDTYPAACCTETGLYPHHHPLHDFDHDRPAVDTRYVV
jgi:Cys-rich protein (TIGR01571 family)